MRKMKRWKQVCCLEILSWTSMWNNIKDEIEADKFETRQFSKDDLVEKKR